jgi:hypothetical protein
MCSCRCRCPWSDGLPARETAAPRKPPAGSVAFAERSAPNRLIGTMSDTPRETRLNPRNSERSRSGWMVAVVVLLLSIAVIGAVIFWANPGELSAPSRTATTQPAAQPPQAPSPPPRLAASDDTMQSLNALQQSVKDLQSSQQHLTDQLDLVQRRLAAEQGERKMLSEQVGALSGRVDGLSTSATKKPASR